MRGFTLAETLITIGIIGVVAALVIPNVVDRVQERVLISQLQKQYNKLSNAIEAAQNEYGGINEWAPADRKNSTMQQMYRDRVGAYLDVVKKCSKGNDGDYCGETGRVYKTFSGGSAWNSVLNGNGTGDASVKLSDGSYVAFGSSYGYYENTGATQWQNWGMFAKVYVDINGKKGPNVNGKDNFAFIITDKKTNWSNQYRPWLMPYNYKTPEKCLDSDSSSLGSGRHCTAWVLYYKNMDYIRCADLMKSTNTHSCKEAKAAAKEK